MTEAGIAWLAGLIEGEGTIVFTQKNSVALNVFMTDEDVLWRCKQITGTGTVRGPYVDSKRPTHKPIWKWSVTKGSHVEGVLLAVRPWMGKRRTARIDAAVARLSNMRGRERCQQGHDRWRVDGRGKRYCRECANVAQRLRRAAAKVSVE